MFDSIFSTVLLQVGELIEGIFEFGFWVAIILVLLLGGVGYWLYKKFRGQ